MNFEEHAAKPLLAEAGIPVPEGGIAASPEAAAEIAGRLDAVVVKAQVPAGKRGKAGGIKAADGAEAARRAAAEILAMEIGGHRVERVLVEARADIARELYGAVLTDSAAGSPLVMFSTKGGMDIEEVAASEPDAIRRQSVDIAQGFDQAAAAALVRDLDLGDAGAQVAASLAALYRLYRDRDAEMVEINPLVITGEGQVVALDCKFVLDDSAVARQEDLADRGTPEPGTALEARGGEAGLKYIELDGDVGVLANGAGLTMTTMDAIVHYGGRPANFLEIGGEAYTKAMPALELVLANPRVKSLVVNFCGAFARCDVMTEGVVRAWEALTPDLPVFFSIHGTGEAEAQIMVRERLGLEPFDLMDDAIKAAIEAAIGAAR
jgi:succinyl-CoA synthetase beta subunit